MGRYIAPQEIKTHAHGMFHEMRRQLYLILTMK